MSEHRRPLASVAFKHDGVTSRKVEIFDAAQFGGEGYRLRVDGRWLSQEPTHCADYQALLARIGDGLAEALGQEVSALSEDAPELPRGTLVRVPNGNHCPIRGELHDITRTRTEPIRGYDGRWYVSVYFYGRGAMFVPVAAIKRA